MQTVVMEENVKFLAGFDSAVLIEESGEQVVLFQREEGSWLKIPKKVYQNICWCFENHEKFEPKYDNLLSHMESFHLLACEKAKHLENITVMLTDKCNLSCKHCCASEMSASCDVSFDVLHRVIGLEPMQITITGGEPLLHKDIRGILHFLKKEYKGTLALSTNGTLVDDYLDLILAYIDKVEISLDGLEEKDTEKYRGKGVYQKALDAVQMLKQHEIPVALSLVSCDGREKEKFFQLNEKYGTVPLIRELYLNDRVLGNIDALIPEGKKGYIRIVRNAIENERTQTELASCGACSYQLFVDCEGNVYPCGGLSDDMLKIGNIQDTEVFEKIKTAPEICYRSVMERLLSEERFSKCRECRVRCFCWNCISNVLSKSVLPEIFEAYCKSSMKKWEHFVWEKGE